MYQIDVSNKGAKAMKRRKRYAPLLVITSWIIFAGFLFGSGINAAAEAPEIIFDANFGVGFDTYERPADIIQLPDGSFVMVGWTGDIVGNQKDMYIVKTNHEGIELWSKRFEGEANDAATALVATADGGLLIVGYTYSYGAGGSDVWIIKTDAMGDMQWNRTIGGAQDDSAQTVIQTTDGGFLIAGNTSSMGEGGADGWLIKLDMFGDELWQKTYGSTTDDYINAVIQDSNETYFAIGSKGKKAWMLSIDGLGNLLWEQAFTYQDSIYHVCAFNAIHHTIEEGYLIAGQVYDQSGALGHRAWYYKLDRLGSHEWDTLAESSDSCRSVHPVEGGGYILTCNAFPAAQVVHIDDSGFPVWQLDLEMGSNATYPGKGIPTLDGGYAVAATAFFGMDRHQFWLVKLSGLVKPRFSLSSQDFSYLDLTIYDSRMGDVNNNGHLDIVVSGMNGISSVYVLLNDGQGNFSPTGQIIGNGNAKDLLLRDFDNDGDLDIVFYADNRLHLYLNDGNGNFANSGFDAPAAMLNMLAAGDLNNDGFVDFVAVSETTTPAQIYLNNGQGGFLPAASLNVWYCHEPVIGDLNGDGYLDIGLARNWYPTRLYFNDGYGGFSDVMQLSGNFATQGGVYFVDLNGNGILDVFEGNQSGALSRIFFNDGMGNFTDSMQDFGGYLHDVNKAAFGDIDNDGSLDILATSTGGEAYYLNRGNGLFDRETALFKGQHICVGDVDGDGDLDVFGGIMGGNGAGLFINSTSDSVYNSKPSPPTSFAAIRDQDTLTFSWQSGSDAETEESSLTYNLRVGTVADGNDIFSGVMPCGPGNVGHSLQWSLRGLTGSVYYWSVQTIDSGYATSEWSPVQVFPAQSPSEPEEVVFPTGTLLIDGGASYSNTPTVTLTIASEDADEFCFSNDGIDFSSWERYIPSKQWVLFGGDGLKNVYAQLRNEVGLTSLISAEIVLDTTAPMGLVNINNGDSHTLSTSVFLEMTTDDAAYLSFSNDDQQYSPWEPFLPRKSWVLPDGEGLKTVHVKFRDSVGNFSIATDSITLVTADFHGTVVINNHHPFTTSPEVLLSITSPSAAWMCFSNDGSLFTDWELYQPEKIWRLSGEDGEKHVFVKLRDNYDRIYVASDGILLCASIPGAPVLIDLGITNDNQPLLDWEVVENAMSYELEYGRDVAMAAAVSFTGIGPSELRVREPLMDGTWYWRVRAANAFGITGPWSIIGDFVVDTAENCETPILLPVLIYPPDNATGVELQPTLLTGHFVDGGHCSTHWKTHWMINDRADHFGGANVFNFISISHASKGDLTSLKIPAMVLDPGTTYFWRVRYFGDGGNKSEWSEVFSFTTRADDGDSTGNGIPDRFRVDDETDLNKDGIPDNQQVGVITSVSTVQGRKKVGINVENIQVARVDVYDEGHITDGDGRPDYMPFGLIGYKFRVPNYGDTAIVHIHLSEPAPEGAKWVMYDEIEGWQDYSAHATFNETRDVVTVELKDGGFGDKDYTENRWIVDPSGVGVFYAAEEISDEPSIPKSESSSGGCFIHHVLREIKTIE